VCDAFTSHITYSVFSSSWRRKQGGGSGILRDLGVDPESGEIATRAGSIAPSRE
jgi:hypothetical protein